MLNEELGHDNEGREPDFAQARRSALKAHDVVIKLKEMGLPESLDNELASLSTDLGDLWASNKLLSEQLDTFLQGPPDWGEVGDHMTDIRSSVDHIAWHLKSVRSPLNRITRHAYRTAGENGKND